MTVPGKMLHFAPLLSFHHLPPGPGSCSIKYECHMSFKHRCLMNCLAINYVMILRVFRWSQSSLGLRHQAFTCWIPFVLFLKSTQCFLFIDFTPHPTELSFSRERHKWQFSSFPERKLPSLLSSSLFTFFFVRQRRFRNIFHIFMLCMG